MPVSRRSDPIRVRPAEDALDAGQIGPQLVDLLRNGSFCGVRNGYIVILHNGIQWFMMINTDSQFIMMINDS